MTATDPGAGAVSTEDFRRVMSRFATGVAVVTCAADRLDHAMTANSFTSVSLDPPLVLVCVEIDSRFHEAITDAGMWSVSVLDEAQRGRASWFATRGRPLVGQFEATPTHRSPVTGALVLDGSLVDLDVRTVATYPGGDHDIVVGEVLGMHLERPDGHPLLYFASTFQGLDRPGQPQR